MTDHPFDPPDAADGATTPAAVIRRRHRQRQAVRTGATRDAARPEVPSLPVGWTVVAVVAVFLVHLVPGLDTGGPMVFEDELGYLMNSRAIATGAGSISLGEMGFYHAGWSLMMAPLNWLFDDPSLMYRASLVLVSALSTAVVLPLSWLGRRVLGLAPGTALATAAVAAVYPARVLLSGYVFGEAMFALVFACTAVAAVQWWDRRDTTWAVLFGLGGTSLYLVHGRGIGMMAVTILVLGIAAVRDRDRRPLAGIVAAVGLFLATTLLHRWLKDSIYNLGFDRESAILSTFTDTTPKAVTYTALGHLWYLTVASSGMALLGGTELVRRWWGELRDRVAGPMTWIVGAFATLAVITIPSMSIGATRGTRLDYLIYGRHFDGMVPVLVVLGLGVLLRAGLSSWRWAVLPATAALGLAVETLAPQQAVEGAPIAALSVAGIAVWIDPGVQAIPIVPATLAAMAVYAVVAAIPTRRELLRVGVVGVAFVAMAVAGEVRTMSALDAPWQEMVTLQDTIDELGADAVAFDESRNLLYSRNGLQFWLPDVTFDFFDGEADDPPDDLVVAPVDWARGPGLGARIVAREPLQGVALWVMPGPLADDLERQGRLER